MLGSIVRWRRRTTAAGETRKSSGRRWFPRLGRGRASKALAWPCLSLWGCPEDASCRSISGCRYAAGGADGIRVPSTLVLLELSSRVCSRFLRPRPLSSFPHFLSLGQQQVLCRCRSALAAVAKLSPCPICLLSSPARYAPEADAHCAARSANLWQPTSALCAKPHQQ